MPPLLYRWFIRYNPLYFFSALCVLIGVFLVSHELASADLRSHGGLSLTVQVYEFLLIGAAALLARKPVTRRAAVILGIVEICFLFDAALASERIASLGRSLLPLSAVLGLLGAVKLWLLAAVFRLRVPGRVLWTACGVVMFLHLAPHMIEPSAMFDSERSGWHLILFWSSAIVLAVSWGRTRWESRFARTEWSGLVLHRVALAAPFVMTGLVLLHGIMWSILFSVPLSFSHTAPLFLAAGMGIGTRMTEGPPRAAVGWATALFSIVAAAGRPEAFESLAALGSTIRPVTAIALTVGVLFLSTPRLQWGLPGLLAAFSGIYLLGWEPCAPLHIPASWQVAALCLSLLWLAHTRLRFAPLAVSAIVLGVWVSASLGRWLSADPAVPIGILSALVWLGVWTWWMFPSERWTCLLSCTFAICVAAVFLLPEAIAFNAGLFALAASLGVKDKPYRAAAGLSGFLMAAQLRDLWFPASTLGWGVLVLTLGFALLAGGVAVNLYLSRFRENAL